MSRLKIAFLAIIAIVFGLVIGLPFLFSNNAELATFGSGLALYIIFKVVMGLILVAAVVYALKAKGFNGTNTTLVLVALVYQLAPLGIRYFVLNVHQFMIGYALLILAVLLIGYVGLYFGLTYQDQKMIKGEEAAKGHEIPVEEEKVTLKTKEPRDGR